MTDKPPMTRWKAAAIHLAISIVVILGVGAALMFIWYGPELFSLMGAERLLTILAIVDIVIGPFLTLIVFKHAKKSLKFDLVVIALLQIGFLAYGIHIMWQSRPVFLVGVLDRFEMVFSNQLSDEDMARGRSEGFKVQPLMGPRVIGGLMGQTAEERLDLAMKGVAGRDIHLLPERYVAYERVAEGIAMNAKPVDELIEISPEAEAPILRLIGKHGVEREKALYVPITAERGRATMILEAGSGRVLGPLAIDPWPDLEE